MREHAPDPFHNNDKVEIGTEGREFQQPLFHFNAQS